MISRFVSIPLVALTATFCMTSCIEDNATRQDTIRTQNAANTLQDNQPTPTDIDYSLERYNLIKRAYWVNGQREKANSLPCAIDRPLGYIVLIDKGATLGRFVVDGKVSSLNSYLTPDSEYYEYGSGTSVTWHNEWLADIDGSYGSNDNGIFFFTTDGKYVEWTGDYLYSDIPFEIDDPVITFKETK